MVDERGAGPHQLTSIGSSANPVTYNGVQNPTFQYDANGNMKSGAGRSFSWMSFNRLANVTQGTTSLTLSYGPEHQRYKMCAGACGAASPTTTYLYDPATGGMSEKYIPGVQPNIWRDYIVADGQLPRSRLSPRRGTAVRILNGSTVSWRYVANDHLGSPTTITDTGSPMGEERDSGACPPARGTRDRGMPGASAASPMPPTTPAAPSPRSSRAASPAMRCWTSSASST